MGLIYSLAKACPKLRDSLLDLLLAVKEEEHTSLKKIPCPKFGGYDFLIKPNLTSDHGYSYLPIAPRQAFPSVDGPVDYREQRALFQCIDAILFTSGLEQDFINLALADRKIDTAATWTCHHSSECFLGGGLGCHFS